LGRISPRIVPHVRRSINFFRIELEVEVEFRMKDGEVVGGTASLLLVVLEVLEFDELSEECDVSSVVFVVGVDFVVCGCACGCCVVV